MSKFKIERGDYVCIAELSETQVNEIIAAFQGAGGRNKGDIDYDKPYLMIDSRDGEIWTFADRLSFGMKRQINVSDILEDRTTWHPHHDVIVAWAKGAKIRGRRRTEDLQDPYEWAEIENPRWDTKWEYEVIPEPGHTAEIADIERKMRELSEAQKELADRLEKLK